MAEMNWFNRWFINFSNVRRSTRILRTLGPSLALPPSPRILELGAGRGGMSALLHERFRPAKLIVSDFDPNQLDAARRFLDQRLGTLPSSIELRKVDATNIPFEPGSCDCVFAIGVLHHVEAHHGDYQERPKALREIRRVLAPGGLLVYWEFSRTDAMRTTLTELGFVPVFDKPGRKKSELAIVRAPTTPPVVTS